MLLLNVSVYILGILGILHSCRRDMVEILPIRRKTLYNQSINQSFIVTTVTVMKSGKAFISNAEGLVV